MAKQIIYCVTAYRWADRENHSYVVGCFTKKHAAIKRAEREEDWRGGKYGCEVIEVVDGDEIGDFKVIREPTMFYPEMNQETGNTAWITR